MVSKAVAKYVHALHLKKYRTRHGAFLVEGGKSVRELLSSGTSNGTGDRTAEFAEKIAGRAAGRPTAGRCFRRTS